MYHRYTDFFAKILEEGKNKDNSDLLKELSTNLKAIGVNNNDLNVSLSSLQNTRSEHTPTKLLEKKLQTFVKNYYELISTVLTHTISENVKAGDRWAHADNHYKKLHLKDQLLLGDHETMWILQSINNKLENFVDQKIEKEKYAMKITIPTYYSISQSKEKRILGKRYYIPRINDVYEFFYFWKDANTIQNPEDFSIFRWSYRNLSDFTNYSGIINDTNNPAQTKYETTDLTKKGLGASYDIFSTQVEANRWFNVLNMEPEYELYKKEKNLCRSKMAL